MKDGILHGNNEKCHYDHQYDNKVYVCRVILNKKNFDIASINLKKIICFKLCHEAGKETVVIPKTSATNDNSFVGIVKYTYSG